MFDKNLAETHNLVIVSSVSENEVLNAMIKAREITAGLLATEFDKKCRELDTLLSKISILINKVKAKYSIEEIDAGFSINKLIKKGSIRKYILELDPKCFISLKKVFKLYSLGELSGLEFFDRVRAAIRLSLNIKERDLYQLFVFLSLLLYLKADILMPSSKLILERKTLPKKIPATVVLATADGKYLSIFYEALRPVKGCGIPRYRPDLMVYNRPVFEVTFSFDRVHPLPDYIVEIESGSKWFEKENARIWGKISNIDLVKNYIEVFQPHKLVLVSRVKIPHAIREDLAKYNIVLIDGVYYDYTFLGKELTRIFE